MTGLKGKRSLMEKWNAVWLCVVKEKPNLIHSNQSEQNATQSFCHKFGQKAKKSTSLECLGTH